MEKLGWILDTEISDINYLVYRNDSNKGVVFIDLDKRKITTSLDELSFALLEEIRKIVINNAIY
jgi:hypothetical protein